MSILGQNYFAPKFTPSTQPRRSTVDRRVGGDQSQRSKRTYVTSQTTQRHPHFRLELPVSPPLQLNTATRNSTLGCFVGGVSLRKESGGVSDAAPSNKAETDLAPLSADESPRKKTSRGVADRGTHIATIISNDGTSLEDQLEEPSDGGDCAVHTFAVRNVVSKNEVHSTIHSDLSSRRNPAKRDSTPIEEVEASEDVLDLMGAPA